MRLLTSLLVLVCCVGVVATSVSALTKRHHVVESIESVPAGWTTVGRAHSAAPIRLLIALKQENLALLESTLLETSNPKSSKYGQHWSNDAIHSLIAPKKSNVDAVMKWLSESGIKVSEIESTSNKDFLRIRTTVAHAEKLLHTHYSEFTHPHRPAGHPVIRTMKYKVPSHLAHAIDIIGPTVRFPKASRVMTQDLMEMMNEEKKTSAYYAHHESKHAARHAKKHLIISDDESVLKPNNTICVDGPSQLSTTPDCLRALYAVGDYTAAVNTNSSVGVSAFEGQTFVPSDLILFLQTYDPLHVRNATTVIGDNDWVDDGAGMESTLDIQYSMAMSPVVPSTFWYDNTTDQIDFNLDWLYTLQSSAEIPWVLSDSYGVNEEVHTGPAMDRFNVEFQKLGLRGVSMLFAMGDGGVGGGSYPALDNCTVFIPAFPTAPYVTTVGGTDGYAPEAAWVGSSGGFSNYYAAPSYQTSDIQNYFTKYASSLPAAGLFNTTGRGFPDVSFQSTNFAIVNGGQVTTIGGTSASSPSFAGLVALLNDIRFQAGKTSLGFLNPLFYTNPTVFTDITIGSNPGCNSNGFDAEPGWDPVTGLGTPNFQLLSQLVLSLP